MYFIQLYQPLMRIEVIPSRRLNAWASSFLTETCAKVSPLFLGLWHYWSWSKVVPSEKSCVSAPETLGRFLQVVSLHSFSFSVCRISWILKSSESGKRSEQNLDMTTSSSLLNTSLSNFLAVYLLIKMILKPCEDYQCINVKIINGFDNFSSSDNHSSIFNLLATFDLYIFFAALTEYSLSDSWQVPNYYDVS